MEVFADKLIGHGFLSLHEIDDTSPTMFQLDLEAIRVRVRVRHSVPAGPRRWVDVSICTSLGPCRSGSDTLLYLQLNGVHVGELHGACCLQPSTHKYVLSEGNHLAGVNRVGRRFVDVAAVDPPDSLSEEDVVPAVPLELAQRAAGSIESSLWDVVGDVVGLVGFGAYTPEKKKDSEGDKTEEVKPEDGTPESPDMMAGFKSLFS